MKFAAALLHLPTHRRIQGLKFCARSPGRWRYVRLSAVDIGTSLVADELIQENPRGTIDSGPSKFTRHVTDKIAFNHFPMVL